MGDFRRVATLLLLLAAFPLPCPSQQPPAQEGTQKADENKPGYTVKVTVPLVTVNVTVLTHDGLFVPGLAKENFLVLEDGEPQPVVSLNLSEAPITAVLLLEHIVNAPLIQYGVPPATYGFVDILTRDDWGAAITFDKEPHILQDFTQDKDLIRRALETIPPPLLREANLYDALYDTLDRLEMVKGRKYVILVASGMDSLSQKIFDRVLKKTQLTRDTVIYSLDTFPTALDRQAANQMRAFATMTGGKLYFPSSREEYADVFKDIGRLIRNQYSLSYHSTHKIEDGVWHKIKIQVLDADGRKSNYQIIAREGYRATREVK